MYIETERLIIRDIEATDGNAFSGMASDGSLNEVGFDAECCSRISKDAIPKGENQDQNEGPIRNPWEEISLEDYENHMKLESVMQLQAMNEMMKGQLGAYPAASVMILGIAGGNGLEHVPKDKFERVYGVDVNPDYLDAAARRYPDLDGLLECLCIDLLRETDKLPKADMVIANLLIEYIGYECFQKAVRQIGPDYVSCMIQINTEEGWVSDSPYLHVFDGLEQVHHQIEEHTLERKMLQLQYRPVRTLEHNLPNGKKLVRIDFESSEKGHK